MGAEIARAKYYNIEGPKEMSAAPDEDIETWAETAADTGGARDSDIGIHGRGQMETDGRPDAGGDANSRTHTPTPANANWHTPTHIQRRGFGDERAF